MAVIVTKQGRDSELQKRIQADMDKKVAAGEHEHDDTPDFVDDSEYLKETKKTGKFGWVWLVLIVLAIISLISIFVF